MCLFNINIYAIFNRIMFSPKLSTLQFLETVKKLLSMKKNDNQYFTHFIQHKINYTLYYGIG